MMFRIFRDAVLFSLLLFLVSGIGTDKNISFKNNSLFGQTPIVSAQSQAASASPAASAQSQTASQLPVLSTDNEGVITAETTDSTQTAADPDRSIGADLLGVVPGETTLDSLKDHPIFGHPFQKQEVNGQSILMYKVPEMPEMPTLQLLVHNQRVEKVLVQLDQPRNLADAQKSFAEAVGDCRPFYTTDSQGYYREIFPERGFVFVIEPDPKHPGNPSDRVIQIIAETVKPEFFIQRALMDLNSGTGNLPLSSIQHDAQTALGIDSKSGPARKLMADTAYKLEDYKTAQEQIIEAIRLNPNEAEYHLLLMNILNATNRADEGLSYLAKVEVLCSLQAAYKAEFEILRGDFLRRSSTPNEDGAIQAHQQAIQALQPFQTAAAANERIEAKRLMIRAYISLALDIAQKNWPQPENKEKAFLWIDAAASVADDLVRNEHTTSEPVLDVCLGGMETGLLIPDSPQSDTYIDRITALGDLLSANVTDPLYLQNIYWRCGRGLFNGFRIAEMRGDETRMALCANDAFRFLEPFCDKMPRKVLSALGPVDYDFAMFFGKNPEKAAQTAACRERAVRMMEEAADENDSFTNGENGIRLANLGKAYWQEGNPERGLALTVQGIEWLRKSAADKQLDRKELVVPLRNAAVIAEELHKTDEAAQYTAEADEIAPAE